MSGGRPDRRSCHEIVVVMFLIGGCVGDPWTVPRSTILPAVVMLCGRLETLESESTRGPLGHVTVLTTHTNEPPSGLTVPCSLAVNRVELLLPRTSVSDAGS